MMIALFYKGYNKQSMSLLRLSIFIFFSIPNTSFANDVTRFCVDISGKEVRIVDNPKLHDFAYAKITSSSLPIIEMNKRAMTNLPKQIQDFVFWHECGHHALGHIIYSKNAIIIQEQEADCYGIRALLTLGLITHKALPEIQAKLSSVGTGDWEHLPGKNRSLNLNKCLGVGLDESKWAGCKSKFYENLIFIEKATATLNDLIKGCNLKGQNHPDCLQAKTVSKNLNDGIHNAIGLVDWECPFVMEPKFNKVLNGYSQALSILNLSK